ncbi:MAG: hypothetical protein Q7S96_02550 [bacterium]|nr:hypothetical protein [bacterium]
MSRRNQTIALLAIAALVVAIVVMAVARRAADDQRRAAYDAAWPDDPAQAARQYEVTGRTEEWCRKLNGSYSAVEHQLVCVNAPCPADIEERCDLNDAANAVQTCAQQQNDGERGSCSFYLARFTRDKRHCAAITTSPIPELSVSDFSTLCSMQ